MNLHSNSFSKHKMVLKIKYGSKNIICLPFRAIQKGCSTNNDLQDVWSPNVQTVFKALASARLCAAVWNNITDCDETYNYWEPVNISLKSRHFPLIILSSI